MKIMKKFEFIAFASRAYIFNGKGKRNIFISAKKKGVHSLMDYFYSTFRNLSTPEQRNLRSSDGGKANKVSTSPKDFLEEVIMNRSKCSRDCFTVCHIANFVKKFVKTMICVWLVP